MISLPATTSPLASIVIAAVEVGDKAAGLAHQDDARRHIPGLKVALPVAVEPAGGDPGEVERGGAELRRRPATFGCIARELSRGSARRSPRPRCGRPQAINASPRLRRAATRMRLVVEERALAFLGDEQLVGDRIVDEAGDDDAFALERDRDGEMRNAVQEVGGAVERIDDPAYVSCRCLRVCRLPRRGKP